MHDGSEPAAWGSVLLAEAKRRVNHPARVTLTFPPERTAARKMIIIILDSAHKLGVQVPAVGDPLRAAIRAMQHLQLPIDRQLIS